MEPLHLISIIGHGIGLLFVLIGLGIQVPRLRSGEARVNWLALGGAALLLLSGVALATNLALNGSPNWPKLAIKLVIALAIAIGLYVHRATTLKAGMLFGMIALVLVNVTIAMVW